MNPAGQPGIAGRRPWRNRVIDAVERRAGWIPALVFLLASLNLIWFFLDVGQFGGGALAGTVQDGHYFLRNHAVLTEVDRATWEWMRFHESSVFFGYGLTAVVVLLISLRRRWQWIVGGPARSEVERRILQTERSGPVLLRSTPAMRVASAELGSGDVRLNFYPGGMIIELRGVEGRAILRRDVRGIEEDTSDPAGPIVITHRAPDVGSPLVVMTRGDSTLVAAIRTTLGVRS